MNEKASVYWNEFWKGKVAPSSVDAWQFGMEGSPMADELASLVISGKKTATCAAHAWYEDGSETLPAVGDHSIILNSNNAPVAIIKITDVQVMPMNEVPVEFAIAEGEGDLSYDYWWEGHKKFFTLDLAELGKEFSEDMLVVCERFELVDVKATDAH